MQLIFPSKIDLKKLTSEMSILRGLLGWLYLITQREFSSLLSLYLSNTQNQNLQALKPIHKDNRLFYLWFGFFFSLISENNRLFPPSLGLSAPPELLLRNVWLHSPFQALFRATQEIPCNTFSRPIARSFHPCENGLINLPAFISVKWEEFYSKAVPCCHTPKFV